MSRIRLWRNYYLGTGLITVVGTSFATLSTASSIFNAMYRDGTCPSTTAADGTVTQGPCPDAYGHSLQTDPPRPPPPNPKLQVHTSSLQKLKLKLETRINTNLLLTF